MLIHGAPPLLGMKLLVAWERVFRETAVTASMRGLFLLVVDCWHIADGICIFGSLVALEEVLRNAAPNPRKPLSVSALMKIFGLWTERQMVTI